MRRTKRYDVETLDGALVTSVGPPPPREWKPITPDSTDVTGARVALAQPTEWWEDLRVICEPFPGADAWYVRIAEEADWYRHRSDVAQIPLNRQLVVPLREVWIEA